MHRKITDIGIDNFEGIKVERFSAGIGASSAFNPLGGKLTGKKSDKSRNGKRLGRRVRVGGVVYESMSTASLKLGFCANAVSAAYRKSQIIAGMKIEVVHG